MGFSEALEGSVPRKSVSGFHIHLHFHFVGEFHVIRLIDTSLLQQRIPFLWGIVMIFVEIHDTGGDRRSGRFIPLVQFSRQFPMVNLVTVSEIINRIQP